MALILVVPMNYGARLAYSKDEKNAAFSLHFITRKGHHLNPKKVQDLQKMTLFVSDEHKQFYTDLSGHLHGGDPDDDD